MTQKRSLWSDIALVFIGSCFGVLIELLALLSVDRYEERRQIGFWVSVPFIFISLLLAIMIYIRRRQHVPLPDRRVDQMCNFFNPALQGSMFAYVILETLSTTLFAGVQTPLNWFLSAALLVVVTFVLQAPLVVALQKSRNSYDRYGR